MLGAQAEALHPCIQAQAIIDGRRFTSQLVDIDG